MELALKMQTRSSLKRPLRYKQSLLKHGIVSFVEVIAHDRALEGTQNSSFSDACCNFVSEDLGIMFGKLLLFGVGLEDAD